MHYYKIYFTDYKTVKAFERCPTVNVWKVLVSAYIRSHTNDSKIDQEIIKKMRYLIQERDCLLQKYTAMKKYVICLIKIIDAYL